MYNHKLYVPMSRADILYDLTKTLTDDHGGCTTFKTTGFWNAGDHFDVEEVIVVEVITPTKTRPPAIDAAIDALIEAGESAVMVSTHEQQVDFISAGERLV